MVTIIATIFHSPLEIAKQMAQAVREKRLSLDLSQQSLSQRSGVSLSVVKKFEHTGSISLGSLLKIALALDSLNEFSMLFKQPSLESLQSLDELLAQKTRQRGRK